MAEPLQDREIRRMVCELFDDAMKDTRAAISRKLTSGELKATEGNFPDPTNEDKSDSEDEEVDGQPTDTNAPLPRATQVAVYDCVGTQLSEMFGLMLASIKRKRNTLAPIEALSDELLSLIFLFAVVGEKARAKLKMSHVCARWRTLFASDARLWTDIELRDARPLVRECLQRAGEAPLDLRYSWNFEAGFFGADVLDVFEPRAAQVRSLVVNIPASEVPSVGVTLVTTPLPIARAVSITVTHSGWGDEISTDGPPVEELFAGSAPKLNFLRLQKFGLPWSLAKLTELTTIMLDKCYFMEPTAAMDFITILEGLPALKQLSLTECRNLCFLGSMHTRSVSLPELQVTQLEGLRLTDTVHILSSLSTQTHLRLSCKLRFNEDDPLSLFSELDLSRLTSLATVQDLAVDISHNSMVAIETITLTGASVKSGANKNMVFTLAGDGIPWSTQSFPAVCEPFNFTRLRKLTINWRQCGWGSPILLEDGMEPLPPHDAAEALMYFLRRCPDVVCVSLSGWNRSDVLEALAQCDESAPSDPACPKLHTLRFEMSRLTDEGLRNLVLHRPGCAKLRYLTIVNSYGFKSETVDWLRENVEDVYWDGEANEVTIFDQAVWG